MRKRSNVSCPGSANTVPIYTKEPEKIGQAEHGELFTVGSKDNEIAVLHLYGTPYEMGFARGILLKDRLKSSIDTFYDFLAQEGAQLIEKYIKVAGLFPEEWIKVALKKGIEGLLRLEADIFTKKATQEIFKQELEGIAAASNIAYERLLEVQMFPELIKAHCSMLGAWGSATDQGLLQLRALDFSLQCSINHDPLLAVRHPSEGKDFLTLGWTPMIGALTGYSKDNAISEKVWLHHNGKDSRFGIPFNFLLRNILQFDHTFTESLQRIQQAKRTCSVFLGIGTKDDGKFKAIEYSHDTLRVFDWDTPFPGYAPPSPQHPAIQDVVYIDKHTQPSSDPCMASYLQSCLQDQKLQAGDLIQFCSFAKTGDTHILVSDFTKETIYIAVATPGIIWSKEQKQKRDPAYGREFIELDAAKLLARKKPAT